jgi:Ciliary BBSome complex subunit 2, C-terminal
MCTYIGLSSFSSDANFPAEMTDFEKTIENIASLSDNTVTQATAQADEIANLKFMMVMAEDARSV